MATVNGEEEEKDIDVVTCPLCMNNFSNPKQLECLHNFCEKCLQANISSSEETEEHDQDSFTCPVCKWPNRVPVPNTGKESWAAQMPSDDLIASLANGIALNSNTQNCTPCKRDGKTTTAKHWW